MIPSINDFTSYWQFDELEKPEKYTGILFGENILVFDNQVINLSKLFDDNSRIYNAIRKFKCGHDNLIYILLENNKLYKINITDSVTHKLIRKNVKNIFTRNSHIHVLKNNGNVLNSKCKIIYRDISVVPRLPHFENNYGYMYVCNKHNKVFELGNKHANNLFDETLNSTKNVVDICVIYNNVYVLYDDDLIVVRRMSGIYIGKLVFCNIVSISVISQNKLGIMHGDNNVLIYDIPHHAGNDSYDCVSQKGISITNSPYCAQFNAESIPYYPKYFMDRFIAFIMSVKHSYNIKLPKYLYFMIANYLK